MYFAISLALLQKNGKGQEATASKMAPKSVGDSNGGDGQLVAIMPFQWNYKFFCEELEKLKPGRVWWNRFLQTISKRVKTNKNY